MIKIKAIIQKLFDDPKLTTLHPQTGKAIKYSFSINNNHYFEFNQLWDMPKLRLRWLMGFEQEMKELKLGKDDALLFTGSIKKALNKGDRVKAGSLLLEYEDRLNSFFDPEILYNLASGVYFELKEDVEGYDPEYNKEKIELFKKKDKWEYFFMNLIEDSENLGRTLDGDLKEYSQKLKEQKEILQKYLRDTKES